MSDTAVVVIGSWPRPKLGLGISGLPTAITRRGIS